MYDKAGLVLRVETVINNPEEFRVRKQVLRKGKRRVEWVQMRKGVALASDAASSSAAMASQAQHAPTSIASGAANSRAENLKKSGCAYVSFHCNSTQCVKKLRKAFQNLPATQSNHFVGTGSQLDSLSLPGDSFWKYSVNPPSASNLN
jgi:hypothetical protein